jgi:hypothetical protein
VLKTLYGFDPGCSRWARGDFSFLLRSAREMNLSIWRYEKRKKLVPAWNAHALLLGNQSNWVPKIRVYVPCTKFRRTSGNNVLRLTGIRLRFFRCMVHYWTWTSGQCWVGCESLHLRISWTTSTFGVENRAGADFLRKLVFRHCPFCNPFHFPPVIIDSLVDDY